MGPPIDDTVLCTWIYLDLPDRTDRIRIRACGLQCLEIETPSAPLDGSPLEIFLSSVWQTRTSLLHDAPTWCIRTDAHSRIISPGVHCREGLMVQRIFYGPSPGKRRDVLLADRSSIADHPRHRSRTVARDLNRSATQILVGGGSAHYHAPIAR